MTPQQQRLADLLATGMTNQAAADAMGIQVRSVYAMKRRMAEAGEEPEGVAEALATARAQGADAVWLKSKEASILWRRPKEERDPQAFLDAIRKGLADLPRAESVSDPLTGPADLMAVFPVADLHIGLLTDMEEVGAKWDTKIALRTFEDAFARIVDRTPAAGVAVLAQLGDLTHNDDQRNVTPQSGHQLDVDSRYYLILRRAVAAMKSAIEALRVKYPRVVYRGMRGNHDLTAHHAVTLALAEHYRDTAGVQVVQSANEFHVQEFGRNMVLLHHGDRAKPDRLVQFAAAQWPEIWGRTRHRLALSGHVHHETRKEVGGMTFEAVGTIVPRDFHAYSHAYSARRSLISITLDREQGETARARVGV